MKIGIDAHAAERDGSGNCTYIRNLLASLLQLDDRNEYVLYAANRSHPFYQTLEARRPVHIKEPPFKFLRNPLVRIPLWMALETVKDKLDVLHVQYIAPPFHKGKLVTTIHDLGFLHVPETFSGWEVLRSKLFVRMTAKKSDKIITGSRFSKQDIVQSYRIAPSRVEVVPLGASSGWEAGMEAKVTEKTVKKYGIRKPYLLSVGRLNPRKNLAALVEAFSLFKKKSSAPHMLVIAGKHDYASPDIIRSVKISPASRDILFTGFIPGRDLPSLYKEADVFVYPSLFEGVGLPVLEAMSLGTPVITSNSSSLKETAGNAAVLADPSDPASISRAMVRLTGDPALKQLYAGRGMSRAQKFSWRSTAEQTLKIYHQLF